MISGQWPFHPPTYMANDISPCDRRGQCVINCTQSNERWSPNTHRGINSHTNTQHRPTLSISFLQYTVFPPDVSQCMCMCLCVCLYICLCGNNGICPKSFVIKLLSWGHEWQLETLRQKPIFQRQRRGCRRCSMWERRREKIWKLFHHEELSEYFNMWSKIAIHSLCCSASLRASSYSRELPSDVF